MGFWIGIGGAIGACARFILAAALGPDAGTGFPIATFSVNVSGSVLLGFLHAAMPPVTVPARMRAFLTIGLCGGFTTFSTFDQEMLTLLMEGRTVTAAAYAAASVLSCVAGVFAGIAAAGLARVLARSR